MYIRVCLYTKLIYLHISKIIFLLFIVIFYTHNFTCFRCLQSRCHYLDGGCLSSPRWSSLLVAEIYYPDTVLSGTETLNGPRSPVTASQPPPVQDFQVYSKIQMFRIKHIFLKGIFKIKS